MDLANVVPHLAGFGLLSVMAPRLRGAITDFIPIRYQACHQVWTAPISVPCCSDVRSCSWTIRTWVLMRCDEVMPQFCAHQWRKFKVSEISSHLRGLFVTTDPAVGLSREIAVANLSTVDVWRCPNRRHCCHAQVV